MSKIMLLGNIEVEIPSRYDYAKCKKCGADDLIFAKTKNGKLMPIHWKPEGFISHFSDCPNAGEFRRLK